jgi:N-acetylglucosamine-6-phosphate deacetylase
LGAPCGVPPLALDACHAYIARHVTSPIANPAPSVNTRPSLFDLQVNGFAGVDFQQPKLSTAELRVAVDALRAHSVHRFLLTLITANLGQMADQLARIEAMRSSDPVLAETIVGYHLEGPYLSSIEGYHGAHLPELMRTPDTGEFAQLHAAAGGRLRLLTLAPELPGSTELIRAARNADVLISLGHTNANEAEIDAAIAAGATLCTHLGNGVPSQLPRHDNVIQRLLARDELTACFIPDGLHLPPFVLRNLVRAKPAGKVILTSDAMAAAGAPPGRYTLGHVDVEVGSDGIVREPGKPNFAGSSLTLDRGVTNAARWLGISEAAAWELGSARVADLFGVTLPQIPVKEKA